MTLVHKRRLRSGAAALFGILLFVVFFLPGTSLVSEFVTIATVIGSLGAILYGLTFWKKARVKIGRLKFRFKVVRRSAGVTALVFLSFLVMQRGALHVWGIQERGMSKAPPGTTETSAAARLAEGAAKQPPTSCQFISGDNLTFSPDGQRVFSASSKATMSRRAAAASASFCSLREKFDADSRVAPRSGESIADFSSASSSPARSLRMRRAAITTARSSSGAESRQPFPLSLAEPLTKHFDT